MIRSVEMKSGFAAELPFLKGRRFEFSPKINVLLGSNGCGKTTLLKVIAGHTGINTSVKTNCGGWSKVPRLYEDRINYPKDFSKITIDNCSVDLDWDGTSCFYNSSSVSESTANNAYFFDEGAEESTDGMTDMMEQIGLMKSVCSEGQFRIHKIKRTFDTIQKPSFVNLDENEHDSISAKEYKSYIMSLGTSSFQHTLLWDEPDRSLNVKNQISFWTNFLPQIATKMKWQVIITTHSLIPLLMNTVTDTYNLINVEPNYKEDSVELLDSLKKDAKFGIKV